MVFASIREHAEHCDFFASTSRIKNLLCELASNAKIWGPRASEHRLSLSHPSLFPTKVGGSKFQVAIFFTGYLYFMRTL